jgi:hypothetical protein
VRKTPIARVFDPIVRHYLALVDEGFDHKAWHGTTLRGSLRRVSAEEAARRPARGRHNIWEIVVHAAYWKYTVRRRLSGQPRGSFPLSGSDWFPRSAEVSEEAWRRDIVLLEDQHRLLRDAVGSMSAADLDEVLPGSEHTRAYLVRGIAAHDLYHAGQIQLLKRMVRS